MFDPGASHTYSRVIDHLALREGKPPFIFDAVDAFYSAPETEECYVDPPKEYLKKLEAAGESTDI